jgi:hypothetical protein
MDNYDINNPGAIDAGDIARFFGSDPKQEEWDASRSAPQGLAMMQSRAAQLGMTNDPASYLAMLQNTAKVSQDMATSNAYRASVMGPEPTQEGADAWRQANNVLPDIGKEAILSPLAKMEAARLELTPTEYLMKQRMGSANTDIRINGVSQGQPSDVFSGKHTQEQVYNHPTFQQMIYGDPAHAANVFKAITNQDFGKYHDATLNQRIADRKDAAEFAREQSQLNTTNERKFLAESLQNGRAMLDPKTKVIVWRGGVPSDSKNPNSPISYSGDYGLGNVEEQRISNTHGQFHTGFDTAGNPDLAGINQVAVTERDINARIENDRKIAESHIQKLVDNNGLHVENGKLMMHPWESDTTAMSLGGEQVQHINRNKLVPAPPYVLELFKHGGSLAGTIAMQNAARDAINNQPANPPLSAELLKANYKEARNYSQPIIRLNSFLDTEEKKQRFNRLSEERQAQIIAALQHGGQGWQADQPQYTPPPSMYPGH